MVIKVMMVYYSGCITYYNELFNDGYEQLQLQQ